MANNYGTGYPPYQYTQQPTQPNAGYQPAPPGYQQFTDAAPEEYRRQPAYAPVATAPVIQPMPAPIVQQQPLYAPATQQYYHQQQQQQQPQQQQYQQQPPPTVQPRPNVVVIHNTRSPGCFCMCLKAICDIIWTIIVFIIIGIMVVVGIAILRKYVN